MKYLFFNVGHEIKQPPQNPSFFKLILKELRKINEKWIFYSLKILKKWRKRITKDEK